MNYWLILASSSTLLLIIFVGMLYYCYMARKNKSLLTVVSLNNNTKPAEKTPQVNPFENYQAEEMNDTQQGKLNLVKANVGDIVSNKGKAK